VTVQSLLDQRRRMNNRRIRIKKMIRRKWWIFGDQSSICKINSLSEIPPKQSRGLVRQNEEMNHNPQSRDGISG
jgi:hypothetical protein